MEYCDLPPLHSIYMVAFGRVHPESIWLQTAKREALEVAEEFS